LDYAWTTFKLRTSSLVAATFGTALALCVAHGVLALTVSWPVAAFASLLLSGLAAGGMMNAARIAGRGDDPSLRDAFQPFSARQGDYLLVGLGLGAGVVLCWVGVLATNLLFLFAPLLVAEGSDYKQALTRSKDLVLGNFSDALSLFAVLAALNMLGAITVIGWLVTVPLTALTIVKAYEQLARPPQLPDDANDSAAIGD
jgi:predicted small integral membrane protein